MRTERQSRPARAVAKAPRFDLRFEAGRGELRLRAPYEAAGVTARELALDLGRIRFPIDVSRGPAAFRDRATRLRALSVLVDSRAIARAASKRGLAVRHLSGGPDAFALGVADSFGTIACTARPFFAASDLGLFVSEVRTVRDGPTGAFERLARALALAGFELDPQRGFFRFARPLRALLRELVVPFGYRIPDERGLDVALRRGPGRTMAVDAGVELGGADRFELLEAARALAPALSLLAGSHTSVALDTLEDLTRSSSVEVRRMATDLLATTLDEVRAAGGELASRTSEPVRLCLRVRAAARSEHRELTTALEELTRAERVVSLAVEALTDTIERAGSKSPEMLEIVERAVRRSPGDEALLASYVAIAERAGSARALSDAAESVLDAAIEPEQRLDLVLRAARALDRHQRADDARELLRRALVRDPERSELLEVLAAARARAGERERAVLDLDHAIELERAAGRLDRVAALSAQAADLLAAMGRPDSAAERLERAIEADATRGEFLLALARVRRSAGASRAASQIYSRLLAESVRPAGIAHALVEAALFHLDDLGDVARATEFVERLARDCPDEERLPDLLERVGLLQELDSLEGIVEDDEEVEEVDEIEVPERAVTEIRVLEEEVVRSVVIGSDSRAPEPDDEDDPAALRVLAATLREQGRTGDAALALARAGVLEGDAATLRAAFRMAQQAGASAAARRVVELALDAVGDGPARDGWLSLLNDSNE